MLKSPSCDDMPNFDHVNKVKKYRLPRIFLLLSPLHLSYYIHNSYFIQIYEYLWMFLEVFSILCKFWRQKSQLRCLKNSVIWLVEKFTWQLSNLLWNNPRFLDYLVIWQSEFARVPHAYTRLNTGTLGTRLMWYILIMFYNMQYEYEY